MTSFRANSNYTAEQIACVNWIWDSGITANYDDAEIRTAAIVASAHYLASIDDSLKRLVGMANSLGLDGLHQVIQDARSKIRAEEDKQRQHQLEIFERRNRALRLKRQRALRAKKKITKGKGKQ